jgi:uncharacterized membrane protein
MTVILVAIGVAVLGLFFSSVVLFTKERTLWRFVQLCGALCFVVVVLTHFAETFHLLPGMGWGLPNSAGHYLDLISTVLGLIFFPLGYVSQALARRKNSK